MCNTSLSMEECSLMDHINHLLDESFSSGFAFSGVLLCCVSSVIIKTNNRCNKAVPIIVSVIVKLMIRLSKLPLLLHTCRLMVY